MGDSDQGLKSDVSAIVDGDQHLYTRFMVKLVPLTTVSDEGHLTALFVARKPIVGGKGVRRSVQLNS